MTVIFLHSVRYFLSACFFIIEASGKVGPGRRIPGAFSFFRVGTGKRDERMAGHGCKKSAKRENRQDKVQPAFDVETAVSVNDVASLRCMADYF